MKQKILLLGVVILLLTSISFAQQDLVKAGIKPGNVLYGLDRALERIRLMLTFDDIKEAKLHLRNAEERLSELNELLKRDKTKYTDELVNEYDNELEKAQAKIEEASRKGRSVEEISSLVAEATYKHVEILKLVLEKVPEQAKEHIQHAIDVSIQGNVKAVENIEKETGKPADVPRAKPEKEEKGKLVMQITDKPGVNITKLEITISSIKVHTSAQAIDHEECVEETYEEIECYNESIVSENCTNITAPQEVCVNETFFNETCTEPLCINGSFINDTCVNGTFIPINCTNQSYVEEVCHNETVVINQTCVNETIIQEVCENVTKTRTVCTNETTEVTAGWKTVLEEEKTFDLIVIQDVKKFLAEIDLEPGKYTQIRLRISNASLEVSGVQESLKIPSNKLKLIHPFTINSGETTTLTLDFDAQKSVHKAGDKYILKPTIKIIQE